MVTVKVLSGMLEANQHCLPSLFSETSCGTPIWYCVKFLCVLCVCVWVYMLCHMCENTKKKATHCEDLRSKWSLSVQVCVFLWTYWSCRVSTGTVVAVWEGVLWVCNSKPYHALCREKLWTPPRGYHSFMLSGLYLIPPPPFPTERDLPADAILPQRGELG